jgi:hypothetical protein
MAPRLVVQGVRFPQNGQVDVGLTVGNGYQARAALAFSPLDFYKGLDVMALGAADCAEHEIAVAVDRALNQGDDRARLSALRAQEAYFLEHRHEWQDMATRAAVRLGEHTITLVEFDAVRKRVSELDRRLAQAQGEVGTIEARGGGVARPPLSKLAEEYNDAAVRRQRAEARVRSLEPWQLQVTAGVIPQQPIDWYGLAELTVNLGGLVRLHQDDREVEARLDEVRHAPYEVEARVERSRAEVAATLAQAKRELEVVERDLATLQGAAQALDKSDAASAAHARDAIAIERLSTESEAVFLRAFIASLTAWLEDAHV